MYQPSGTGLAPLLGAASTRLVRLTASIRTLPEHVRPSAAVARLAGLWRIAQLSFLLRPAWLASPRQARAAPPALFPPSGTRCRGDLSGIVIRATRFFSLLTLSLCAASAAGLQSVQCRVMLPRDHAGCAAPRLASKSARRTLPRSVGAALRATRKGCGTISAQPQRLRVSTVAVRAEAAPTLRHSMQSRCSEVAARQIVCAASDALVSAGVGAAPAARQCQRTGPSLDGTASFSRTHTTSSSAAAHEVAQASSRCCREVHLERARRWGQRSGRHVRRAAAPLSAMQGSPSHPRPLALSGKRRSSAPAAAACYA
ncbi:hypothetical protein FA09DRAFT_331897 [Tilletiopsis washingtonensis]|uniref:Uncharacterized protein n=1 Tax=Tilletiopsis washingtonensis TaxID=58919 RepID=A0A316Z5U0_9BASI|nr:hypothetical protein FA09DRAFT_331897 [Tilletiopsis washingtonensis]PWN95575.1 hypothetical protein FA09DRAFT_331897 [Tilletiopsis washingtonensis]